ncbi:redox-regulated ATPase YchF [candidate division WWE3 bacterium]|uniref:Ribosome-binding ATPase YchF n=1 Tax=candidate division WWE3 bacterium TaxID=2053526 RepID=A0A955LHC4_UNCKA|nr:redox-regulated ATPase YchF [candidate division WWE3 bacterium]
MSLQAGFVGLPNVGKSTLFNALLSRQVAEAANYPFCTIEPNVGVVEVPDERLPNLAEIVHSSKLVPAAVEFVDIAGLVEGAHKGEGLGNQFLTHIREVNAIIFVLRNFSDPNVTKAGSTTPADDLHILETELQLADLNVLEKQKEPKGNVTKEEKIRWSAVQKIRLLLEDGQNAREADLTEDEEKEIKSFSLLTKKPAIVVLNSDEETVAENKQVANYLTISLCAKLEEQMNGLDVSERKELLEAYGINEPGLSTLIKTAYALLGLITFLTAGEKEVRAWPIRDGFKAPEAAGTIHTDFEKGFVKAKVVTYDEFVSHNGWKGSQEAGKVRLEGKEYIVREGDVIEFMVNT